MAIIGMVSVLNGVLEKVDSQGAHLVKSGAPLHEGDVLTLLTGQAYIQFIKGFPEALSLSKSVVLDGLSPVLKVETANLGEEIVKEAIAKGIDPTAILNILGSTAAGNELIGSGGEIFILDPLFSLGLVTSGYDTAPVFSEFKAPLQQVFFSTEEPTESIPAVLPIASTEELIVPSPSVEVVPPVTVTPPPGGEPPPLGNPPPEEVVVRPDLRIVPEGLFTSNLASILTNDDHAQSLVVSKVASIGSGLPVDVDAMGLTYLTTENGGIVVIKPDGTFSYIAPVFDHPYGQTSGEFVTDSFYYKASNGTTESDWTKVDIHITDSVPTAFPDVATVVPFSSVSGNILTNDMALDIDKNVSSITVNGNTYNVPSEGSTSITTANGTLIISADGNFTYNSNPTTTSTHSFGGDDEAGWRANLNNNIWGFVDDTWQNGNNLDLNALALQTANNVDNVSFSNAAHKAGLGVKAEQSGGGTSLAIDSGDALIMKLPEATKEVTVGITQENSPQVGSWRAYAADGSLVASGNFDFTGQDGVQNGTLVTATIMASVEFTYLAFVDLNTENNSQGYFVADLSVQETQANSDVFAYTMLDHDGDASSSTLTINPADTNSFVTSIPSGSEGNDAIYGDSTDNAIAGLAGDDHLEGGDGNDTISGGDGNDVIVGGIGADILSGDAGNDYLHGGPGDDHLSGGAGNDVLDGGLGNDILSGGPGNDLLIGGGGIDTFVWMPGDEGTTAAPTVDTILDFKANPVATSTDASILNLSDLLQGEHMDSGPNYNLDNYLNVTKQGNDTVINVAPSGADPADPVQHATQVIVLKGVDLTAGGTIPSHDIIETLVHNGNLITGH